MFAMLRRASYDATFNVTDRHPTDVTRKPKGKFSIVRVVVSVVVVVVVVVVVLAPL